MLGQLLFKGHWSLRSTISRIIYITQGTEIQRARAPHGAVKRCLCLTQLIILPSVLGSDSSAGSGSSVNVLTPSSPSSHYEDRLEAVIFSSSFCFTQMLDSTLKQEKIIVLLLGRSTGLRGASSSCRDETCELTSSIKTDFICFPWGPVEKEDPPMIMWRTEMPASILLQCHICAPREMRLLCLKSELGQAQWMPLPKATQQVFHRSGNWSSASTLITTENLLETCISFLCHEKHQKHSRFTAMFMNIVNFLPVVSPCLSLNHSDSCICHPFHIREQQGKSYCTSIPDNLHSRAESRFAVLRGIQAKPALCYKDHYLSKSYTELKQFEIQQIHSVRFSTFGTVG